MKSFIEKRNEENGKWFGSLEIAFDYYDENLLSFIKKFTVNTEREGLLGVLTTTNLYKDTVETNDYWSYRVILLEDLTQFNYKKNFYNVFDAPEVFKDSCEEKLGKRYFDNLKNLMRTHKDFKNVRILFLY